MLFSNISILNNSMQIMEHQYVGITNDKITYISNEAPKDVSPYGRVYNGKGKLLLPAFYNCHSHIPMSLLRGYGENLSLHDWLHQRIFPFEAHMTANDIYYATLLGIAEMLRYGIVSTTDMYSEGDAMFKAFAESGAKANISMGITCFDERSYAEHPVCTLNETLLHDWHLAENGRLHFEYSLHAEYTTTEKIVRGLAETAQKNQLPIHIHVSETASEHTECQTRHNGLTPVAYLEQCGVFQVPVIAAHCVHITDNDIAILRQHSATVATCPKSNLKLASGICPAGKLIEAGVNLAISTDSVSSNNNLNMLEELRIFALLHKGISGDPTLITPAQAIYHGTKAGAIAQGRPDCGEIKLQNKADLIVLDISQPYLQPQHDLLSNIVYSASGSDIILTMCDGKVLYDNGEYPTLDIEKIIYQSNASCKRIIDSLQ